MKWRTFLYLILVLLFACSDSSKKRRISISVDLPENLEQDDGPYKSFITEPTAVNEINCFGLFLRVEEDINGKSCETNGTIIDFQHTGGLSYYTGGSQAITIDEVLANSPATAYLVGFKVTAATNCPDFNSTAIDDFEPGTNDVSEPYIISTQSFVTQVGAEINFNLIGSTPITNTQIIDGCFFDNKFAPDDLPSLFAWYDAQETDSVFIEDTCTTMATNGLDIRCWKDLSGNGYDILMPTGNTASYSAATSPEYLLFEAGSSERMVIPFSPNDLGAEVTIFVVYEAITFPGTNAYLLGASDGTYEAGLGVTPASAQFGALHDTNLTGATGLSASTNYISTIRSDGTTVYLDHMGVNIISDTYTFATPTPTDQFDLGAFNYNGTHQQFFDGKIKEVIFYNTHLSADDRADVIEYLNDRW